MAKQISISDEIYNELIKRKNKQSFSEVIKVLMKNNIKTSGQELIELCAGKIPDLDDKAFFEMLDKEWKKWKPIV